MNEFIKNLLFIIFNPELIFFPDLLEIVFILDNIFFYLKK
jgi:hypothetical protein